MGGFNISLPDINDNWSGQSDDPTGMYRRDKRAISGNMPSLWDSAPFDPTLSGKVIGGAQPNAVSDAEMEQNARKNQPVTADNNSAKRIFQPKGQNGDDSGRPTQRQFGMQDSGGPSGLVQPGNINLTGRPILNNSDGTISSEKSFSIGTDKGETLLPLIVNGKELTQQQAIDHYKQTGEHMGIFDTPEHADAYANQVHNRKLASSGNPVYVYQGNAQPSLLRSGEQQEGPPNSGQQRVFQPQTQFPDVSGQIAKNQTRLDALNAQPTGKQRIFNLLAEAAPVAIAGAFGGWKGAGEAAGGVNTAIANQQAQKQRELQLLTGESDRLTGIQERGAEAGQRDREFQLRQDMLSRPEVQQTSDGPIQYDPKSKTWSSVMVNGQPVKAKQKFETPQQGYAAAVSDAMARNVDPETDPKVMQWKAASLGLQKDPQDNATKQKDTYMGILQKAAGQGTIDPSVITDAKRAGALINNSTYLSPEEKRQGISLLSTITTPSSAGTNVIVRSDAMLKGKEFPVVNAQTRNVEYRNADEINKSPGQYIPYEAGTKTASRESAFQDFHYTINGARQSLSALDDLDAGTRAKLSYALKQSDPKSSLQAFMSGADIGSMSPQQQDAVQWLSVLAENAMALRSVQGMGQSSDELRASIQAMLPSGKSPNRGYALEQLNKFEGIVNRMEKGVPKSGLVSSDPAQPSPMPTVSYKDGNDVYAIPRDKELQFKIKHPNALKQ